MALKKPDIEIKKPDIDLTDFNFAAKTKENISLLYNKYYDMYFGRTNVIELLSLSPSRASEFLKQLLDNEIIEHVKGKGKGKYIFKQK